MLLFQTQEYIADLTERDPQLLAFGDAMRPTIGIGITYNGMMLGTTHLIDMAIAQNDKKPRAQIGSGLPGIDPVEGTH